MEANRLSQGQLVAAVAAIALFIISFLPWFEISGAVTVGGTTILALAPTRVPAGDIVRIDVVADPDRIVPDPLRDNNILSWTGTMQSTSPQCTVTR